MQPVKAKKHLGQHFLADPNTANKIALGLTGHKNYKKVLEIGPGTGALTQHLIPLPYEIELVEIDHESIDYLKAHYPDIKIYSESFLNLNFQPIGDNIAVIGNFPYNISSQILFKVLDEREKIPEVVGMFQKEVAERVAEGPGSKRYGILSVLIQAYYDVEYLFTVNETVFIPPPKVKSGVIRLKRKEAFPDCPYEKLRQVVKLAFNQRRKTLRNSLKSIIQNKEEFIQLEVMNKRPEQLSVDDFVTLTQKIN